MISLTPSVTFLTELLPHLNVLMFPGTLATSSGHSTLNLGKTARDYRLDGPLPVNQKLDESARTSSTVKWCISQLR